MLFLINFRQKLESNYLDSYLHRHKPQWMIYFVRRKEIEKKLSLQNFGLNQLKEPVLSGRTRKERWRKKQLMILSNLLENHQIVNKR